MSELEKFVKQEQKAIEKKRQDYMEEHDMKDFITWKIGSTKFTLLPTVPRDVKGDYGNKKAFRIIVDGTEYDWTVNPDSPVYRWVVAKLLDAPVDGELIRVGEGKSTRYDIAWAEAEA